MKKVESSNIKTAKTIYAGFVGHPILTMMRKNRDIDQTRTVNVRSDEQSFQPNSLPKLHPIRFFKGLWFSISTER